MEIRGAVQGVGFRPYVYRLAAEEGLAGWVVNDTRGVFIEVEGPERAITRFMDRLPVEHPPLAHVESIRSAGTEPLGERNFHIRVSDYQGAKTALILPDAATCAACMSEVFDPQDRRFRYPFTNCTNCGPRFSIIADLPYDRPNTTMVGFTMCDRCRTEYEDPANRRFHAQPNACPDCGPQLELLEREGDRFRPVARSDEALAGAAAALADGKIVAVKGLGGFHLMVDAADARAISMLRSRKPRPDKPLALMARDLDQVRTLVETDRVADALLTSPEAPIVLLRRRPGAPAAGNVAPGNPTLGVMLAYTPLHHLLLDAVGFPVVATSGNLTDEPICTSATDAIERLGHIADHFLVHDRPIQRHVDDSVTWIVNGHPSLLRRARGYAPMPVPLSHPSPPILAVGAHLKNTVTLAIGERAFVGQHIGDLETPQAQEAFERVITDFLRIYDVTPEVIAHDLHPDYVSTRWAHASNLTDRLVAVQHHHAHLASCLAENQIDGPALGITWDGTGYGSDGTIWGGEFLVGDASGFDRVAHLRTFGLPGGDAAAAEPRRVALALLWEHLGEDALDHPKVRRTFTDAELLPLSRMLQTGFRTPRTSSVGRLFDGVASLLDLHQRVSFEGQAAMALEFAADPTVDDAYPRMEGTVLDWGPLLDAIIDDLARGAATGVIAARFHNALATSIVGVARRIDTPRVALTGGCFQNRLLTERATKLLRDAGYEVLLHRLVPPNDGGISLGQVAVAAEYLRSGRP
ncbi:MAG: carbamoyltransferase HypF [Actinobacteria bacterium]|nr:carbamoyltransferase HypF [Actinomycetota bacterium]